MPVKANGTTTGSRRPSKTKKIEIVVNDSLQAELENAKQRLESQLGELIQLRPLPATAVQIMKACRNEELNVQELIQLVECDPIIASRVLSMVNSSMYGYSREIASIDQAVVVLGFKSLSQLTVSIAAEKVFSDGEIAMKARNKLFDHSLGCASVARVLANHCELPTESGAAFLAGMLHDVGKLVFLDVAPNAYVELQNTKETELFQLEQEVFGIDHRAIGERFGELWGLPATIVQAIGQHHDSLNDTSSPISWMTALANALTKIWGIGQPSPSSSRNEDAIAWLEEQSTETVNAYAAEANQVFSDMKSLLSN